MVVIDRDDDVLEEDNENASDMKLFDCELEQSDGGHGGRALTSWEKRMSSYSNRTF